ncbi:kinase-like domain-containing protein [Massariosphaeria phaeospora]|uniref:non-specific serine/threonine protein kinase n=1 Tax=Massariosphaeria phaeospora TaxID=100035 RepID=A0A7C8IFV0_9PLEO|nr:kinase-like domain-containing protein [Massariosphaeria phaeospora]
MDPLTHTCGIDAEPLHRYRVGGYHPIALGDLFNDGRYKVLHKLGWGGYSTVWAAKDLRNQEYVALKVSVAEIHGKSRELRVLRTLMELNPGETGSRHVMQLLNHFYIEGPNGKHECLVLEFLGPSVPDVLDMRFNDERLPGTLAKTSVQQSLAGLAYLHKYNIGHGDLHTRNLTFVIPSLHTLTEAELLQKLRSPEIGVVTRKDGKPLEPGLPAYLVRPTSYPADVSLSQQQIKIIDFGESFSKNDVPETLHTPLCVRAPEAIFGEKLDYRVDLWSAGCMIFELIVGQPPFDSIMATPVTVVRQMLETASDDLPERWQQKWRTMDSTWTGGITENTLQEWLEETYFDGVRKEDFTREDIAKVGALVRRLLRFEPSTRASAQEILQDPWLRDN